MLSWYRQWMYEWENHLCFRSTNRVVRPFEWGLDWVVRWPVAQAAPRNGHSPLEYLRAINRLAMADSARFFGYPPPADFRLEGGILRFTSPVATPYAENNTVHGVWFPAKKRDRAVVVLPHWNASLDQHAGLCRGLQLLGISALRLSLPYHDYRMPGHLQRADYAVSSNIARTVDAARQAVIDTRACLDWLQQEGYQRLGVVGTSLGSCYAFLASAHDSRLRVNVFNHCATYFADVVWTGLSTRHIRQSLEGNIGLEELRDAWRSISPVSYLRNYADHVKKSKFIYTLFDTTFLPEFSREVVRMIGEYGIDHSVAVLPCGHYTLGETPFKFLDGYHICSYLLKHL